MKVMKRLIAISVLCAAVAAAASSCSPLRIVYDTTDKGVRTLCTSDASMFDEFSMAMAARVSPKDTLLAILITSDKHSDHGIFDTNDRLLMRLGDGSEIKLVNLYDHEYEASTETHNTQDVYYNTTFAYAYSPYVDSFYVEPVTIRTMVPRTYTTTSTKSYALYLITKQQVLDILAKDIAKLRIEVENADCDMPDPHAVQSIIGEQYTFLHSVAKAGVKRSEF